MIALIYVVVSGIWIYYSDGWLSYFSSVEWVSTMQTYKGWFFVLATGFGLYLLIRGYRATFYEVITRLRRRRRELNTLIRNLPGVVVHYKMNDNDDEKYNFISQGCEELTGYPAADFTKRGRSFRSLIPRPERGRVMDSVRSQLEEKGRYLVTYSIESANGEVKWIWEKGAHIQVSGVNHKVEGLIIDITSEKQAEQRLRESLQEKEVLLGEVHHRVKNNMALIISLQELQKVEYVDDEFHQMMDQNEKRIKAIAMVHEQLYHTGTLSQIRFDHYMDKMISSLFPSFAQHGYQRSMNNKLTSNPLVLNVNQAIPCALLLQELISYAESSFYRENNQLPRVEIDCGMFDEEADLTLHFRNADENKIPSFDQDVGDSLPGLMVQTLTEQLDADLDIEYEEGVIFRFRFPLN